MSPFLSSAALALCRVSSIISFSKRLILHNNRRQRGRLQVRAVLPVVIGAGQLTAGRMVSRFFDVNPSGLKVNGKRTVGRQAAGTGSGPVGAGGDFSMHLWRES